MTAQAEPVRRKASNKNRRLACTCWSGSSIGRPSELYRKPTGRGHCSSPRRALFKMPPWSRERITCSSASDIAPFKSQQDSVVKLARIVESILIQDQGVGECADFQEPVPVRGIARQSRNLQAEHNPGFFQTYFRYQLLKSCAIRGGRSRVTEVAVNNDDAFDRPTQRYGPLAKIILSERAFRVLAYLSERGLPDIQIGV